MKTTVLVKEQTAVSRSVAEAVVVVFLGVATLVAHETRLALLLFPELAALSHDVITRPRGRWALHPWQLVMTPTITAVLGLFLTRHLAYGAWSVALIVGLSLVVIRGTRSTIAPAISAGALPMILGERSWMYPVAIFLGLAMLAVLMLAWQMLMAGPDEESGEETRVLDALEALPHDRMWWATLMGFVVAVGMVAQWTGLRLLLFPPLIVMAYELFGHSDVPGWIRRPVLFPVACLLTATIGLAAWRELPVVAAVMVTVVGSIVVLRAFEVHMPPALAVGLLPFVMHEPNYRFPLSVLAGTVVLTLYYVGYRGWSRRWAV